MNKLQTLRKCTNTSTDLTVRTSCLLKFFKATLKSVTNGTFEYHML